MAHFAEIDENNIVKKVIVVHNNELLDENDVEQEQKGIEFCVSHFGGNWVQTSYNGSFRKNYAGIGWTYDPIRDAFIPKQPFDSWVLNEDTCRYEAPLPYPNDTENFYIWDENVLNWKKVVF